MIDTNIESLAIKAEIKQKLRKEMGNNKRNNVKYWEQN